MRESRKVVPDKVKLDGQVIKVQKFSAETYNPFEYPNLPNAFSKVKDAKSAVRFIQRYGSLGYGCLCVPEKPEWIEPLKWVQGQADTVSLALDIIYDLVNGAVSGASRGASSPCPTIDDVYIYGQTTGDKHISRRSLALASLRHYTVAMRAEFPHTLSLPTPRSRDDDSLDEHIRDILAHLVSSNTRNARRVWTTEPSLGLVWEYKALIEVVWHHVGKMALVGQDDTGARIGRCYDWKCGHPFIASRKLREGQHEFCPPEMGQGKGSRCGLRHRAEERREREREGKK
jgi:hypothetical protein